jgi:hypothetical protein
MTTSANITAMVNITIDNSLVYIKFKGMHIIDDINTQYEDTFDLMSRENEFSIVSNEIYMIVVILYVSWAKYTWTYPYKQLWMDNPLVIGIHQGVEHPIIMINGLKPVLSDVDNYITDSSMNLCIVT